MAVDHPANPWRLVLLLAIAAAAAHSAAAGEASRAKLLNRPPPAQLLTMDHDEPVRDDLDRSQPQPTLPQENTEPELVAATAGRLAAALLRALAEPPPTATPNAGDDAAAEEPWRGAARELAGELLANGRLSVLLQEPVVAAAMRRELRGLRCEAAAVDDEQQHPPQRPDSGDAAGGATLPRQPPLSGEAAIDSLHVHVGAHIDEGDAAASSLLPRPPPPHHKKQDESGGGPLLRAPRSGGASCAADGDCPLDQYCDSTGSCFECSYISPTNCDDASGDCCSAAFRTQCPTNPAGCKYCERDGDCSGGEVCSLGRCVRPSPDKAALLAAFVRDPRA
eukprot:COSAG06_NODE_5475_length_3456_cov_1.631814_4_plen_335_part_01